MHTRLTIALLALALGGCHSTPPLRDTHENLHAVLWMQTSAEYRILVDTTLREAGERVAELTGQANSGQSVASAAPEQPGINDKNLPLAVIVDLDETLLDNTSFNGELVLDRATYDPAKWSAWVAARKAEFMPGAEAFVGQVRAQGVTVLFVTNRDAADEANTLADLLPLEVEAEHLLLAGETGAGQAEPWTSEKSSRRGYLAERYWIIAMLGDDLGDFIPGIRALPPEQRVAASEPFLPRFGRQWFLLPNPVYGSWERNLSEREADDAEQLRQKMARVQGF